MFSLGEAYDVFMGRWSGRLAPLLVQFSGVTDGDDVLDVGSGTGALAAAVAAASFFLSPWRSSFEAHPRLYSAAPILNLIASTAY